MIAVYYLHPTTGLPWDGFQIAITVGGSAYVRGMEGGVYMSWLSFKLELLQ